MSLLVSIANQQLIFVTPDCLPVVYSVSTAAAGAGQQKNSAKTPLGKHYIRAKIGGDQSANTVFQGRRPTGELYSESLARRYPQRDWILSRILWLCGCETNVNRLGNVDSMQRYIYIHGMPDSQPVGVAKSHGCIRMRNNDIIELFTKVSVGTQVLISL